MRATRWWDFAPAYMAANADRLQDLAATIEDHVHRPPRPRFVFALGGPEDLKFAGFTAGAGVAPIDQAPARASAYVQQAFGPGPHHWMADCWSD